MNGLSTAVRQARTLDERAHRPWPAPRSRWVLGQSWLDLLFAHWRVDEPELRPHVPDGLEIERHSGSAWLGITPFVLTGLRARGLPPVPLLSTFGEVNVRTYVTAGGKPGIWFFSLDASSLLAVAGARRGYALPYFRAWIDFARGDELRVRSRRVGGGARLKAAYRPAGTVSHARPGSLESFLTERYCLYSLREGELLRAEIHHPPWPLQPAGGSVEHEGLVPEGVELGSDEPLLHFSARQDVLIWPPVPLASDGR